MVSRVEYMGKVVNVQRVFISNSEACDYLGVTKRFLKDLRATGKLSFYKINKSVFYRISDIDKLVISGRVI